MSVNVTTVTVKNKLGKKYGKLVVKVNTSPNQNDTEDLMIPAGDEMMVYPLYQSAKATSLQLESIYMEVPRGVTGIPIPISIDSTDDLNVEVSHVSGQNKWTVNFNSQEKPGVELMGNDGDSNVNVTIGQNEPMESLAYVAVGTTIGLFAGPFLYRTSTILWAAAVVATLVGAVAAWYKSARRKRKKRKVNPVEPIK